MKAMTNPANAISGCLLVGEYVDEAECPTNLAAQQAEVMRPQVVGNYVDLWGKDNCIKEFTILFRDGRIAVVHGHGLRHSPHPIAGQDVYSIVIRTPGEELLVALFKSGDVTGIFHGEIRPDRKTA